MSKLLALATFVASLGMLNGCSKCSRDPAPPVPATEPAATGPEDMNGNPGVAQPGANDPGASAPAAAPKVEEDVD